MRLPIPTLTILQSIKQKFTTLVNILLRPWRPQVVFICVSPTKLKELLPDLSDAFVDEDLINELDEDDELEFTDEQIEEVLKQELLPNPTQNVTTCEICSTTFEFDPAHYTAWTAECDNCGMSKSIRYD